MPQGCVQMGSWHSRHYTALSAWLSCVKDEIYIRAMEDVTEISGPSLVIETQTQTEAHMSYYLFTSPLRKRAEIRRQNSSN